MTHALSAASTGTASVAPPFFSGIQERSSPRKRISMPAASRTAGISAPGSRADSARKASRSAGSRAAAAAAICAEAAPASTPVSSAVFPTSAAITSAGSAAMYFSGL